MPQWQTPDNTLGTNIGVINDDDGTLVFERAGTLPTDQSGNVIADNGIINCTNNTGQKLRVTLQYTIGGDTFQSPGSLARNGRSTFLVVDPGSNSPAPVTVEIYAWYGDSSGQPTDSLATIDVAMPVIGLTETNTVEIWDYAGTPQSPVAIAVAESSGSYPLTFVNRTSTDVKVWVNGGSISDPIAPGQILTNFVDMGEVGPQWILGYEESDDPSIVIRRPPNYKTGG
ncbi:MAG: hypothetical protein AAF799_37160 [Myxococcota bacterium]